MSFKSVQTKVLKSRRDLLVYPVRPWLVGQDESGLVQTSRLLKTGKPDSKPEEPVTRLNIKIKTWFYKIHKFDEIFCRSFQIEFYIKKLR